MAEGDEGGRETDERKGIENAATKTSTPMTIAGMYDVGLVAIWRVAVGDRVLMEDAGVAGIRYTYPMDLKP